MKAVVFDIQRFSIHDGPGIRTARPNLRVRVSGYSAYWGDLSPEMQDEIIRRTCFAL